MSASSPGSAGLVEVPPAYCTHPTWVDTFGPEVAALCTEVAGYEPDPEQRRILDITFGLDERAAPAAFSVCVICGRQNMKTGALKMIALGWLFVTKEPLIIWSAHEFQTASEAHRDMRNLIEGSPLLLRRVAKMPDSSQLKSIELKSGARLIFKARTKVGGRGLAAPKLVLDEAFALTKGQLGSVLPLVSAMPNSQVVYASSAGMAHSEPLRRIRDRGRYGLSKRLGYLEWSSKPGGCEADHCDHEVGTPGCALDRVETWAVANPALGRVRANGTGLDVETIRAEREELDPSEFGRERAGWWDEPGADEVFGVGKYDACGGETPQRVVLEAVGVALTVDLKHAAIVGAGRAGGRVYVQVLAHGPRYDWVPDLLPAGVPVLVATKSPAAVMIADLQDNPDVDLELVTQPEELDAFAEFYTLVTTGELLHDRDPLLITAVNGAVTRQVGDRQAWGRRKSTADITSLEAATLAAWWSTLPVEEPAPPPELAELAPPPVAQNELLTMGF